MKHWLSIAVLNLFFNLAPMTFGQEMLTQYLAKGDVLRVAEVSQLPAKVVQSTGKWKYDKVYGDIAYQMGLQIETGDTIEVGTSIRPAGYSDSQVVGAHGKGTVVKYTGKWVGDSGNGFPNLVVSKGARFVVTKDAEIDLVMANSFYTRQLWAYGEGTGTLELAEGFVADRTEEGTVPNAFGTVRLNGVNLVTHHSQSLPYNTRPDGRGGTYPNGHIVWEKQGDSVWTVKSNPHIYRAQLDFYSDATIDCQASLVHAGNRRETSPEMVGGFFQSTGAFRTCAEDVTITKRGPKMLALEGQQGYYPGAKLVLEQGMLRMVTNPGIGSRYDKKAGPFLTLIIGEGAGALLSSPQIDVERIEVASGGWLETFDDTVLTAREGIRVERGARFIAGGIIKSDVESSGETVVTLGVPVIVEGSFAAAGPLTIRLDPRRFRDKPTSITLIRAKEWKQEFENLPLGENLSLAGGRVTGDVLMDGSVLKLVNVQYPKGKRAKKPKK